MGRRRASGPPISLFSFQDIITSVTGIMILVTLLMAVELIRRPKQAASAAVPEPARNDSSASQQELDELRRREQEGAKRLQQLSSTTSVDHTEAGDLRRAIARATSEPAMTAAQIEQLRQRVTELSESLERMKQINRVVYNPAAGAAKQAWLAEVSDHRLLIAKVGEVAAPLTFDGPQWLDTFRKWLRTRDRASEYFVLLIKPSGIKSYGNVRDALKTDRFDLGFDVLMSEQTAIDPIVGAAGT